MFSRRTDARVDSMGILGSTARYAYLTREQHKCVVTLVKQYAGDIQVMVCVRLVHIDATLHLTDDAQAAGANVLLLPAVSYQSLRDDKVFSRFKTVTRHLSTPVCIPDSPGTTHFTFMDELHSRLPSLKGVNSVMFPDRPDSVADSWQRNH